MLVRAIVKYPHNQGDREVFVVRNISELASYLTYAEKCSEDLIRKVMKASVPVHRWDHIHIKSIAGVTFNAAVLKCGISGGAPLIEYSSMFDERLRDFVRLVMDNKKLVINDNGGWFDFEDESIIIKSWEHKFEEMWSHKITEGTHIICLENDPQLEETAIEFLDDADPNYSYITNLRSYSDPMLRKAFNQFISACDKSVSQPTVYVYTTGMDVEQMRFYTSIAIECGIKDFIFDFNSGVTSRIEDFIFEFKNKVNMRLQ